MSSPLLGRPGAVAADAPDDTIAAHYGDPLREQRRAAEGAGLVDRGNRGVVRISGADRLGWLHSLTTQHLSELPAYAGTESLVLSPHGHVEHHLVLADDGEATWADVEPGTAGELVAFLDTMRFMLRVDATDASAGWAVLTLTGPATRDVLAAAGAALPDVPWAIGNLPGGGLVRRMPWPLDDTADLLVPRDRLPDWWDTLVAAGASPLGAWGFDALRIAARRPRLGRETDHRTIPHEVNWLASAVHLDKGCYRGQETVARVHNLGRPPRRLVLLHLDGSADRLPAPGDPVTWEGSPVGYAGTAARHFELGPVALALVKRSTPDSAPLVVAGIPAAIDPDPSGGEEPAPPERPRLPRLTDRPA